MRKPLSFIPISNISHPGAATCPADICPAPSHETDIIFIINNKNETYYILTVIDYFNIDVFVRNL